MKNDLGMNCHGGTGMKRSSKTCLRASIIEWVGEMEKEGCNFKGYYFPST